MQFRTTGLLLLGAMALPASGTAQTTADPPAITRTVIAATKLPIVTDLPVHFKAVSVTLQPDEGSSVGGVMNVLWIALLALLVLLEKLVPFGRWIARARRRCLPRRRCRHAVLQVSSSYLWLKR